MNKYLYGGLVAALVLFGCNRSGVTEVAENNVGWHSADEYSADYTKYGLNCPVKSLEIRTYKPKTVLGKLVKGEAKEIGVSAYFMSEAPMVTNGFIEFDSMGYLTKLTRCDVSGEIEEITLYSYDDNQRTREMVSYNPQGEMVDKMEVVYEGPKVARTLSWSASYMDFEEPVKVVEYSYEGDSTEVRHLYKEGELVNVIKHIRKDESTKDVIYYSPSGEVRLENTLIYNERGSVIQDIYKDSLGVDPMKYTRNKYNLITTMGTSSTGNYAEYKYDRKGNWTKQIVYDRDSKRVNEIVIRKIRY